jgi:hypothetical protein
VASTASRNGSKHICQPLPPNSFVLSVRSTLCPFAHRSTPLVVVFTQVLIKQVSCKPRLASGLFLFLITSWLSSHTRFRVHGADQIRVPSWSNIMADAIIHKSGLALSYS